MEIKVATERILLLQSQLTDEETEKLSWKNKSKAFGAFHQVSNFINRPNEEDFALVFKERRLLPFWHIQASAKYTYDRTVTHE